MSEIDPVILELRAEMGRYRAELRNQASVTEAQLGRSERAVQRLEKQFLKSSTAISSSFRGVAGSLAAAFSVREIQQLADEKKKLEDERRAFKAETEKHEKEVDALKKATAEAKAAASAPVKKEAPTPAPAGLSTAEEVLCDAFAKLLADPHKKALALSRAKLG